VLNTYITQVQRLLHDANGSYWTTSELTDYINEARNRVAQDTKCLRQVVAGLTLTIGQELYVPQTFVSQYAIDVMGISVYVNNTRYRLYYYPFTKFDAMLRYWVNYQQWPAAFTRMGGNQVYLAPVPNQAYVTDWDVAINPNPLASDSDPEQIPPPFQEPIQYWAAYKAKFKEQSLGETQMFEAQYRKILLMCAKGFQRRIIPDPYSTGG